MTLVASLDAIVTEEVEFAFHVRNTGSDPVELTLRSGQTGELTVTDAETGERVWRWSDGRAFTQAIRRESIDPGDTLVFECTWPDPEPGTFEATATLAADASVEVSSRFAV